MNKREVKLITIILLAFIAFFPLIPISNTSSSNPPAFFSVSILCPNTQDYNWVTIMVEQLPKIGIGVDVFDQTSWDKISPRMWGYPGPYPIPTYMEGGFDIVCLNWDWGLDIDMTGLFDTPSFPPNGDNIYQYSRPEMDWAVGNYSQSFVLADRIYWAHELQALLYEDVPQATVCYPQEVFPHNPNLLSSSWNPLLWYSSYEDMAIWEIPGQTEFNYAVPSDFEDFHVLRAESNFDTMWLSQIYGGMVERNPVAPYNYVYAPYSCISFSSADGITYQVQLDPNVVFADGTKCNASDVKYSYNLNIHPNFSQPDYGFYCLLYDFDSIVINSEYDITINFLQSNVFQDTNLAIDILPKHIWNSIEPGNHIFQAGAWAMNDTLDSNLMGIGPYYLYDCDSKNETIHLKANPHWTDWGGHTAQKFTDIYFEYWSTKESALAALAFGDVDMVDSNFKMKLSEIPEPVNYTKVTKPGTIEMAFNTLNPYFGTGELCPISSSDSGKYIRKAISHMIPRENLIANVFGGLGEPGVTAFPNGAIGFDESLKPYEYNITKALEYMGLAGFGIYCLNNETSINMGFGLKSILGILAFIGCSIQIINIKKYKKKRFCNEK